MSTLNGDSADPNVPAVTGTNNASGKDPTTAGRGVQGTSDSGIGVLGQSDSGVAVLGHSRLGVGVGANSDNNDAVHGNSLSPTAAGVAGFNVKTSKPSGPGVLGHSSFGPGVIGDSDQFDGVFGTTRNPTAAAVSGHSLNPDGSPNRNGLAGFFDGNVVVTGDISLQNADCAEDFDIAALEGVEPGSVMIIGRDGALLESAHAYDKRVAGVVSGGGDYKPGIVLDRREPVQHRTAVALLGKVYCKVDASGAPIEVGDLLTTSPTPGHAMKATDPVQALGAVIGKALRPWYAGCGLIPILVALQ